MTAMKKDIFKPMASMAPMHLFLINNMQFMQFSKNITQKYAMYTSFADIFYKMNDNIQEPEKMPTESNSYNYNSKNIYNNNYYQNNIDVNLDIITNLIIKVLSNKVDFTKLIQRTKLEKELYMAGLNDVMAFYETVNELQSKAYLTKTSENTSSISNNNITNLFTNVLAKNSTNIIKNTDTQYETQTNFETQIEEETILKETEQTKETEETKIEKERQIVLVQATQTDLEFEKEFEKELEIEFQTNLKTEFEKIGLTDTKLFYDTVVELQSLKNIEKEIFNLEKLASTQSQSVSSQSSQTIQQTLQQSSQQSSQQSLQFFLQEHFDEIQKYFIEKAQENNINISNILNTTNSLNAVNNSTNNNISKNTNPINNITKLLINALEKNSTTYYNTQNMQVNTEMKSNIQNNIQNNFESQTDIKTENNLETQNSIETKETFETQNNFKTQTDTEIEAQFERINSIDTIDKNDTNYTNDTKLFYNTESINTTTLQMQNEGLSTNSLTAATNTFESIRNFLKTKLEEKSEKLETRKEILHSQIKTEIQSEIQSEIQTELQTEKSETYKELLKAEIQTTEVLKETLINENANSSNIIYTNSSNSTTEFVSPISQIKNISAVENTSTVENISAAENTSASYQKQQSVQVEYLDNFEFPKPADINYLIDVVGADNLAQMDSETITFIEKLIADGKVAATETVKKAEIPVTKNIKENSKETVDLYKLISQNGRRGKPIIKSATKPINQANDLIYQTELSYLDTTKLSQENITNQVNQAKQINQEDTKNQNNIKNQTQSKLYQTNVIIKKDNYTKIYKLAKATNFLNLIKSVNANSISYRQLNQMAKKNNIKKSFFTNETFTNQAFANQAFANQDFVNQDFVNKPFKTIEIQNPQNVDSFENTENINNITNLENIKNIKFAENPINLNYLLQDEKSLQTEKIQAKPSREENSNIAKTTEKSLNISQEEHLKLKTDISKDISQKISQDISKEISSKFSGEITKLLDTKMTKNIDSITDKVYKNIESRLRFERTRRGV